MTNAETAEKLLASIVRSAAADSGAEVEHRSLAALQAFLHAGGEHIDKERLVAATLFVEVLRRTTRIPDLSSMLGNVPGEPAHSHNEPCSVCGGDCLALLARDLMLVGRRDTGSLHVLMCGEHDETMGHYVFDSLEKAQSFGMAVLSSVEELKGKETEGQRPN